MRSIDSEDGVGMRPSDLRLYARFDCIESARLDAQGGEKSFAARIVDIGLGGVQINSSEPLPVEEALVLRIEQDGKVVLKVSGRARYCTQAEPDGGFVSGFKFVPDSHQERVSIAEFVHSIFQRQWEILAS